MIDSLVSIVTPAYKASAWISETISSVHAQTYSNWEMLVVDDFSPDETAAVVAREAAADQRIRLIRQPRNSGPAAARNAALEAASGRWIAFLDSDDLWLPEKLEQQLAFHRREAAVLTFTEFRRMLADGSRVGKLVKIPDKLTYRQLLGNTAIATSTVLVDRSRSGSFRMKETYYDDFGCWLDLLRGGAPARGLHQDLMRYRVVGQSISRNKLRSAHEIWKHYRTIEGLNVMRSSWYFLHYAANGVRKYRQF
jgi:teichuronic acid biosynthesis glycosyltransferase TuaG